MILAGDVGGTKVDLALYDFIHGKLQYTRDKVFKAKDYPGLEVIVKEFLGADKVTAACFGVPGNSGRLGQGLPAQMPSTISTSSWTKPSNTAASSFSISLRDMGSQAGTAFTVSTGAAFGG